MRLSWRHPVSWRKLRTVELRLTRNGAPVGEVSIRPRGERISAEGAVRLARKQSQLTHEGKTVIARLAVRLDKSLAGQTLTAEVEATDAAAPASSSATPARSAWRASCDRGAAELRGRRSGGPASAAPSLAASRR